MASFFDSLASLNPFAPETKEVTAAKDTLKSIKTKCAEDIAKAEEGVTKAKNAPAAVTPSTPAAPAAVTPATTAAPATGGKRKNRNKNKTNSKKNKSKKRKTARK
jgi:hypothetical protein